MTPAKNVSEQLDAPGAAIKFRGVPLPQPVGTCKGGAPGGLVNPLEPSTLCCPGDAERRGR